MVAAVEEKKNSLAELMLNHGANLDAIKKTIDGFQAVRLASEMKMLLEKPELLDKEPLDLDESFAK